MVSSQSNISGDESADQIAKVGPQVYPKHHNHVLVFKMFNFNDKKSLKNKWITNWLQEIWGKTLKNLKELTNPEMYRDLNRAEQSFVARVRTALLVTQSYLYHFI